MADIITDLARAFDMQNVRIMMPSPNPYGAIPATTTPDAPLYRSKLGTPVYCDIKFTGQSYTDNSGKVLSFPDLVFETVIMSINQSKNIVKTEVQGLDGTVKEYIGLGDFVVSINLIVTGPNGQYPRDKVALLRQMLMAPIPVAVTSWYLQIFGISYLVVESFSIGQEEGGYSYQPVSISCLSDNFVQFSYN